MLMLQRKDDSDDDTNASFIEVIEAEHISSLHICSYYKKSYKQETFGVYKI